MAFRVVFLEVGWGQRATEGGMTPPNPFPKPGILPTWSSSPWGKGSLLFVNLPPLLVLANLSNAPIHNFLEMIEYLDLMKEV